MKYETNIDVEIDIDDSDIIKYVQDRLYPGDVFGRDELEAWAENNGYVKEVSDD